MAKKALCYNMPCIKMLRRDKTGGQTGTAEAGAFAHKGGESCKNI